MNFINASTDFGQLITNFDKYISSSSIVQITGTKNCVVYVSAYNIVGGYNLTATINGIVVYVIFQ